VGRVHASANKDFAAGDWVLGLNGIEEYSLVAPGGFTAKIDVAKVPSPSYFLSALGAVGLTAYFGLLEDGNLSAEKPCWSAQPRCGGLHRRSDCQDQGLPHHRHRRRRKEVQAADHGLRFDVDIDYRVNPCASCPRNRHRRPGGVNVVFENVAATCWTRHS